jgi:chromate transporter
MYRDLVERRHWFDEQEYKDGLTLSQLAPGPLAAQLAIYIGYLQHRILGATISGLAFILPSFLMVLGLGYLYIHSGGLLWIQSAFYGIGSAVIGIIFLSSCKLARKTLKKDTLLWSLFVVLAVNTFLTEKENIFMLVGAGLVCRWIKAKRRFSGIPSIFIFNLQFLQVASGAYSQSRLLQLGWYFLKAGTFIFGSGLAIVPFLYGGVVKEFGWLTERQFLDAVAVAMITPGPVVITSGFIGYLVAGLPGACIAATATFFPCYLITVIAAPHFNKWARKPGVRAFVEGVTAAAVGAIAGAVLVLAKRQLVDTTTIIIALVTVLFLLQFKQIPEPVIIVLAGVAGMLTKGFP